MYSLSFFIISLIHLLLLLLVVNMRSKFSCWINMRCVNVSIKNEKKIPPKIFYFRYNGTILCHVCINIYENNIHFKGNGKVTINIRS